MIFCQSYNLLRESVLKNRSKWSLSIILVIILELGISFFRKMILLLLYLILFFVLNISLVMKTSNSDMRSGKPTSLPIFPCKAIPLSQQLTVDDNLCPIGID